MVNCCIGMKLRCLIQIHISKWFFIFGIKWNEEDAKKPIAKSRKIWISSIFLSFISHFKLHRENGVNQPCSEYDHTYSSFMKFVRKYKLATILLAAASKSPCYSLQSTVWSDLFLTNVIWWSKFNVTKWIIHKLAIS